jgi:hypothetical protein
MTGLPTNSGRSRSVIDAKNASILRARNHLLDLYLLID